MFLGLTLLLLMAGASLLFARLHATPRPAVEALRTAEALAEARAALIGWSVSHPVAPGRLPYPDRTGETPPNLDGTSDCVTVGLDYDHLLGRFPWFGEIVPCDAKALSLDLSDGAGERLWYAVSRNLVAHNRGAPINVELLSAGASRFPWLTVRDGSGSVVSNRVAAVVIAAGPPRASQARKALTAPAAEYLDSLTVGAKTYHNWDSDGCQDDNAGCARADGEDFVQAEPTPEFNDRLEYVTVDELLALVQRRITKDVVHCLEGYARTAGNKVPWAVPVDAAPPRAHLGAIGSRFGRVPIAPLQVTNPKTGTPDPDMPPRWPAGCFSRAWPYWSHWWALVFYAVDDGYRPGGKAGLPKLSLDGGTVPFVVINAGAPLSELRQRRRFFAEIGDISNYLEDDNRDFPAVAGAAIPSDEFFVSRASGAFNDRLCASASNCRFRTDTGVAP